MFPFAHLHVHTCYSLNDGTDTPKEMVRRAVELGMQYIAITDHNAFYGIIPFIEAAKKYGIQPIIGAEMTLEGGFHITLLVENDVGYENLSYLITVARHNAPKGKGILPLKELQSHTQGLIALSGCRRGEIRRAIQQKRYGDAKAIAKRYLEWFGQGNFWIELQYHDLPGEQRVIRDLVNLGKHLNIGCVATNNVHYTTPDKQLLQDIMVCIRHNITVDNAQGVRRPTHEFYLKSPEQMAELFAEYPEAITNTVKIASRCHFELRFGIQDLPTFPTPNNIPAIDYLRQLCETALYNSKPKNMPDAILRLQHELRIIEQKGFQNYFLMIWGMTCFAREKDIWFNGRGSDGNSYVAKLLGISPVDPLEHNLVFERFLSEESDNVPDLDMDVEANRRREMKQYARDSYGADHVATTCTFVTYQRRLAIRRVGKALGIAEKKLKEIASIGDRDDTIPILAPEFKSFAAFCAAVIGLPDHTGQHNGGLIIMGTEIYRRFPTEPAANGDGDVMGCDKDMLKIAHIVKNDILGLRMLQAVHETITLVEHTSGKHVEVSELTFDDPAVYQMLSKGDTIGVFQLESSAQKNLAPTFKPQNQRDIEKMISIIRPGTVAGVKDFVARHTGVQAITYPHHLLVPALEETMGIILWQEQIIQIVRDVAGFTGGQGEQFRRALAGKRPVDEMEEFGNQFISGALKNGVTLETAEQIKKTMEKIGGYWFPHAHAVAFAILVYRSAYLKYYWPAEFGAALLNCQPMGFWIPAVIINDLRRHGIGIKGVDIHKSNGNCTVEGNSVRIGLKYVKGIGKRAIEKIETARKYGLFRDLIDFCRRTKLPRAITEKLILVGAFDEWGIERRKLYEDLGRIGNYDGALDLNFPDENKNHDPLTELELYGLETQIMGLSTGRHIMSFYEDWMRSNGVLNVDELDTVKDGALIEIAGANILCQSPPTANGVRFLMIEGERAMIQAIVYPSIYKQSRSTIRSSPLLQIKGNFQKNGDVMNIVCDEVLKLPQLRSRN